MKASPLAVCLFALALAGTLAAAEAPPPAEVKKVTLDGQLDDDRARLVIQADLSARFAS